MNETSPKKMQQKSGALTAVGAEEEEDAESPWDSEADSESPEEGSPGVLLPAADRHGARSRIVSGERHTGILENPDNSQLKTPASVLEMNETSPKKMQQKSGALTAVGAEEEEDAESPWDSEADSESPEEGSPGVLLPAADRHGARSRIVSGERHTGILENPDNSQLKTPASVLEMNETSPKKMQQKSGALTAVGAEEEEDAESPWDSEADSESPEEGSPGVLLPAADRHGARSRIVSGERHTGILENPDNSQLKTPASVLEMNETSPKKMQQKSGALTAVGAEEEEDAESPWDSEVFPVKDTGVPSGAGVGSEIQKHSELGPCRG
ncbi:uncharacterized protein LOC129783617 [Falco peregrinus]|uniref:uncharacterized protein LOC129783617 n=1 Tax=Falco peregrinus TaxID=8954 RepID=UPI00247A7017|nr:uncharacterized protein LOC129783617 [Falco peregrinus]